jgi:hypothetical protein
MESRIRLEQRSIPNISTRAASAERCTTRELRSPHRRAARRARSSTSHAARRASRDEAHAPGR